MWLGVGKTTMCKKVYEALQGRAIQAQGFYTQEVRNSQTGSRVGFDVVTLNGQRGPLARTKRYVRHMFVLWKCKWVIYRIYWYWKLPDKSFVLVIWNVGKWIFPAHYKSTGILVNDSLALICQSMVENAKRRGIMLNIWFTSFSYDTILVLDLTIYSVSFSKCCNMNI